MVFMTESNRVYLDVRTAEEYSDGHIPGALNMDVLREVQFRQSISQLDKEQAYTVYCRTENRSAKALDILREEGFLDIDILPGGYNGMGKND